MLMKGAVSQFMALLFYSVVEVGMDAHLAT